MSMSLAYLRALQPESAQLQNTPTAISKALEGEHFY